MKKWIYRHWRTLLTLALVVLFSGAMIAILALFPPALPFIAGLAVWASPLLTMTVPAAIAIVTTIAALGVAAATLLFHGLSHISCQVKEGYFMYRSPGGEFFDRRFQERTVRYGFHGAAKSTIAFTVISTVAAGFPLVILLGWAAPAIFGIFCGALAAGALYHAAIYASVKIDNAFEVQARMIECSIYRPVSPPGGSMEPKKTPLSFANICGKLSTVSETQAVHRAEIGENNAENASEANRPSDWRTSKPSRLAGLCAFLSGPCKKEPPPPPHAEIPEPSCPTFAPS